MDQYICQFGNEYGMNTPERQKKQYKNNQFIQYQSTNRVVLNLLNQTQTIKKQLNNYQVKIKQLETQQTASKIRQSLHYKQEISEKIGLFQKQLHQQINETKTYTKYSQKLYDSILHTKIKQTQGFQNLTKKKQQYQNIIGMLYCIKKNMNDKQLQNKVKSRYQKTIAIPGYKSKKSMKQMLIQAQKRQILQKLTNNLGKINDSILKQASSLKNQIKKIQQEYNQNQQQLAQYHYNISFINLQKLKARIQGTIQNYQYQLEQLEQTISLSKPKIYYIQHKDNQIVTAYKKFKEIQQKWMDLERMLCFQFANY